MAPAVRSALCALVLLAAAERSCLGNVTARPAPLLPGAAVSKLERTLEEVRTLCSEWSTEPGGRRRIAGALARRLETASTIWQAESDRIALQQRRHPELADRLDRQLVRLRELHDEISTLCERVTAPVPESHSGPVRTDYVQLLTRKRIASVEDLIRVVARFTGASSGWGPPREAGNAAFREWLDGAGPRLERRGVVGPCDSFHLRARLNRGLLSLLFARALHLDGGLAGSVFGMTERTAYHDLVFARVVPAGGEDYPVSGAELLSVMQRARLAQQRWGRAP
ncbi:MAG: hypothetical protein HY303_17295 [Candidatus Wallbacteria bacterium]|nr:hypothetical protein [Candidatus Wallbacteria bacterium]